MKQAYKILHLLRVCAVTGDSKSFYIKSRSGSGTDFASASADFNAASFSTSGPYSNFSTSGTHLWHYAKIQPGSAQVYRRKGDSLSISSLSSLSKKVIIAATTRKPYSGVDPRLYEDNEMGSTEGKFQRWANDTAFSTSTTRSFSTFGAPSDSCTVTDAQYAGSIVYIGWQASYFFAFGEGNISTPVYTMQAPEFEYNDYI
jgi:hypothetical protein